MNPLTDIDLDVLNETTAVTVGVDVPVAFKALVLLVAGVVTMLGIRMIVEADDYAGVLKGWLQTLSTLVLGVGIFGFVSILVPISESEPFWGWAGEPVIEQRPTSAASAELTEATSAIQAAITATYAVEIVESDTYCGGAPVDFVNGALANNSGSSAKIRLLTRQGVTGCYGAMYDQSSDEVRLTIDASQSNLPTPEQIALNSSRRAH